MTCVTYYPEFYRVYPSVLCKLGTSIITVYASDVDILQNKDLTYSIEGTVENTYFEIDSLSGTIKVKVRPDRELHDMHTIPVKVEDNGSPKLVDRTTVTIHVLDVNDNAPTFEQVCSPFSSLV